MSTTDRVTEYEGPCPCGNGTVVVVTATPDHPYRPRSWSEDVIHCDECSRTLEVIRAGQDVYLARRVTRERVGEAIYRIPSLADILRRESEPE